MCSAKPSRYLFEMARCFQPLKCFGHHDTQVHILYGGTQLMEAKDGDGKEGCCECYVLRTGFSSSQGKLVRKIGTG